MELDLKSRRFSIVKNGHQKIQFFDYTEPGRHCIIDAAETKKVLSKGAMGIVLQLNMATTEDECKCPLIDIQKLIKGYTEVFAEPKELPPVRECDHAIPLIQGAEPPNIRPYRMPHHQKDEIEFQVHQML